VLGISFQRGGHVTILTIDISQDEAAAMITVNEPESEDEVLQDTHREFGIVQISRTVYPYEYFLLVDCVNISVLHEKPFEDGRWK
jgi:hypothetical protein